MYMFIPKYAESASRLSSKDSAWLLSILFTCEVVSRPVLGLVIDTPILRSNLKWLISVCLWICAAMVFALVKSSLNKNWTGWVVFCIIFGSFNSAFHIHGQVLVADIFQSKDMPTALSIFQFFKGIGGSVGPVMIGAIYQHTDSMEVCFLFASGSFFAAGLLLLLFGVCKPLAVCTKT